jgi:4-alpha-glucanotransferase
MRQSGILFPIFSLSGKYGIGCFSKEARKFVDFLKAARQSYWQILPIGPTGYGDSPYQSFSTFAGNPYFIDLEQLISQGLLTRDECDAADLGDREDGIDYGKLYQNRLPLLRKASERSHFDAEPEFQKFHADNSYWLDDYALFMAVKDAHGGKPLEEWEEDIANHEDQAVREWGAKLNDDVRFYEFIQFEFAKEWKSLKDYANNAGIKIIGDIPIYVSADSADFWAHRELFKLDERGKIREIAGVPPDGFSADGQLWGNPLYNWPYHKKTHFAWWLTRIGKCLELYDVLRIDHFRGFDEYFAIPASDNTAKCGHWEKGPGMALFEAVREKFGDAQIIAEDLGYLTDTVRQLVKDTGYPGMKVLEFAFDSRDSSGANDYLTYNYTRNCVVYTGTHDNETLRGWFDDILPEEQQLVRDYLDVRTDDPMEIVDKMVIMAQSSVAKLCVIPLQDYIGLDNSARINHPSTMGKNWQWRLKGEYLTEDLQKKILKMTRLYGRLSD